MEIPVPKFQAKTETEMKNYGVIKTVLTKLYDTENDLIKKRRLAFEDLKNVIPKDGKNVEKEEEKKGKKKDKKYSSLKEIFDRFSNTMQELEDEKEKQVLKIKTKLIPSTEAHITEIKKTKNKISQISLTTKNDIIDEIMQYEADRIQNDKKIMLLLINYEMAYHAKSIAELTELFNDIKSSNLTKSIKESLMSVGVSQNVFNDDDNDNEESEKNEDDEGDDDDNKLLKSSKLSKSKKSSTKKSKNKYHKNDAEDDDDEEEKDDD